MTKTTVIVALTLADLMSETSAQSRSNDDAFANSIRERDDRKQRNEQI
jgi:hypothetical protein